MSDIGEQSALPDDELLAAEYALGVLAERGARGRRRTRRARARLRRSGRRNGSSGWRPGRPRSPRCRRAAGLGAHRSPQLPSQAAPRPSLWQNLAFWRPFALASGALAAACIGALIYLGSLSREPLLVAEHQRRRQARAWSQQSTRAASTVLAVPANLAVTGNRVPELWLIGRRQGPRALGLMRSATSRWRIAIPARLMAEATSEAALAVSLEPPGGSPTGQPTGPVIGAGKLTKL